MDCKLTPELYNLLECRAYLEDGIMSRLDNYEEERKKRRNKLYKDTILNGVKYWFKNMFCANMDDYTKEAEAILDKFDQQFESEMNAFWKETRLWEDKVCRSYGYKGRGDFYAKLREFRRRPDNEELEKYHAGGITLDV